MIECIFTLDYEIYGNGEGSLEKLIYSPCEHLIDIFNRFNKRFVVFVETAELQKIQEYQSDNAVDKIRHQIQTLYRQGFEIGLHLHPQWCNARHEKGKWLLDYKEYNLCVLPEEKIDRIIDQSIAYLRKVLEISDFVPLSFRAGNWLFQPSKILSHVLSERGIKLDSSVFKGGLQHTHKLDYRQALNNEYYWKFEDNINSHNPNGVLVEIPIYTSMVPFWKMLTTKRIGIQHRGSPSTATQNSKNKLYRLMDFMRFLHPLKLDFCRMTITELTQMMDSIIKEDEKKPDFYKPIVAIGHTKDLVDFETVESFLLYLNSKGIKISTFEKVYPNCMTLSVEGK